ncbi:MAG: tRNA preQ1(34) S-adenosylmethionine ribosyltransferase-isomerase QueA [Hyphomicrobiales bacterium]|nr:MAG: tRNA preQ1(34) S-adenosylmethionine ribosyltransferase-isomerase QueA [Hyphomicrobiales bacterium]
MRVDIFDFELPEALIALRPATPRDASLLLVVRSGEPMSETTTGDLADLLQPGDALVFNDTKVIPAQLTGVRERDGSVAHVGVTLHMRLSADTWAAFVKGAKKLQISDRVSFGSDALWASVTDKGEAGEITFQFDVSGEALDEAFVNVGQVPLPPYIASKRAIDSRDDTDYQTIYADEKGAVAAPTAGLHFTPELFEKLEARSVSKHFVTLHVGAGTFLPVKVDDTDDHKMHSEIGVVSAETAEALNAVRAKGGRIVSVGTTSLRLLESATGEDGLIQPWSGATDIFITPGYKFRAVDLLMTNFHLPKSTLFMLVSAFAGSEEMRDAYQFAIKNGYRFYSYGDSSLLHLKD